MARQIGLVILLSSLAPAVIGVSFQGIFEPGGADFQGIFEPGGADFQGIFEPGG